mgnify:CR=1 FL=1
MKEIKIEWCENFIKSVFEKIPFENGGIEVNYFWKIAEASGLWERETYGYPMSQALENLTKIEIKSDVNNNYLYTIFKLK